MLPIILLIGCIIAGSGGNLALKYGMGQVATGNTKGGIVPLLLSAAFSPFVLGGTLLFGAAMGMWAWLLNSVELSYAYPILSLNYVLILLLSRWLFGERLTWFKAAGSAFVVLGVILVSSGAR